MEILINRPFDKTSCKRYVVHVIHGSLVYNKKKKGKRKVTEVSLSYGSGGVFYFFFFQVLMSWLPKGKYEYVVQRANIQTVCCYQSLFKFNVQ